MKSSKGSQDTEFDPAEAEARFKATLRGALKTLSEKPKTKKPKKKEMKLIESFR
jgi:hypothetical protein